MILIDHLNFKVWKISFEMGSGLFEWQEANRLMKPSSNILPWRCRAIVWLWMIFHGQVTASLVTLRVVETTAANLPPHPLAAALDGNFSPDNVWSVGEGLRRISEGVTRKQIVDGLGTNAPIRDYAIRCIYRKLYVHSALAAVSVAVREGIVTRKR